VARWCAKRTIGRIEAIRITERTRMPRRSRGPAVGVDVFAFARSPAVCNGTERAPDVGWMNKRLYALICMARNAP